MLTHKDLKVGDKVIITRASTKKERKEKLWYGWWVEDDMDDWIGKTVIIREVGYCGKNQAYLEEVGYGWPTFVMEKVGSQLLFNFMQD